MNNFDLKKYLSKNPLLTEGQFSWMTQDTDQQIGSEKENTIPVYMFDNKGKSYYENNYDGYGEFGGKDYYDLVAEMNGYTKDDAYELGGTFKELRGIGINLAFGKLEPKNGGPVLFPALVADPSTFNYKTHDFTQEAENDPNQSWHAPEEDDDYDESDKWEDLYGDDDEEDDDDEDYLQETKTNNFDLKAYLANNPLLTEAEEAEKILADTPDEIEAALAKALKMSPDELEKKLTSKDPKEKLDEGLVLTLALLMPAILQLTGKIANKIKAKFLPKEKREDLDKMLKQIKDIKAKHDISSFIDNPFNDTPEQKRAKGLISKIKHDIDTKYGASVPWLKWDKEKGFVRSKKTLQQMGHDLHHAYTSPIVGFLRLYSLIPGTPKWMKDKKQRQKAADLIYCVAMLAMGASHAYHGVEHILNAHGVAAASIADTTLNGVKAGMSVGEIAGEVLADSGLAMDAAGAVASAAGGATVGA